MHKHLKNEARTFARDFATTHRILYVDDGDYIWDRVFASAKQYHDDYNSIERRKYAHFPFVEREKIFEKYKKFRTISDSDVTISEPANVELSFQSCVETLLQNFYKHSKSIKCYRENIGRVFPNKKIYLAFYITDTTTMGNFISVDGKLCPVSPLLIPQFIDAISNAPGLDYIIINTQNFYRVHTIEIAPIREEVIQSLRKNCYNMDSLQYYSCNWRITSSFYNFDIDDDN